jgi:hypothetical protein
MSLSDVVSAEVRNANKYIPLVGSCGDRECIKAALRKLDMRDPITTGTKVLVTGGLHKGLKGTLYSVNTLGVTFVRPDPADGTLKAVKTTDVVRR